VNSDTTFDITWFYEGDLQDRPAAAKVEVISVGVWDIGWQVHFYRPGQADSFRANLYFKRQRAYAVAKRYVRFCQSIQEGSR
jgi:hypothetical protein